MVLGKTKYPRHIVNEAGVRPCTATRARCEGAQVWVAAWAQELGIFRYGEGEQLVLDTSPARYDWADFSFGSWDLANLTLTLHFVDPSHEPLVFVMGADFDEQLVTMIRERVDRSVVYQQFRELPSGTNARGQVRRNRNEELFTEVVVDGDLTEDDLLELDALEAELRDAVGLPQKTDRFRFALHENLC